MRPLRALASLCAVLLVALLIGLWWSRLRIATTITQRKLDLAGVPARYRITQIDPLHARLEEVRIGDPVRPDLTARRIDVTFGYGLAGPVVRAVAVDGVRLRARLDAAGLHLGTLDRLLPKSAGGAPKLPDLALSLTDSRVTLDTPNGRLELALQGTGNPARRFGGTASAGAARLRLASCILERTHATLRVTTVHGAPRADGPVVIGSTECPPLSLGQGTMRISARSNATFERLTLNAALDGFGGTTDAARFAAVHGRVGASGTFGRLAVNAGLALDQLALPALARTVARTGRLAAGLPVTPTASRASAALARLLSDSHAEARLAAAVTGQQIAVSFRQASLIGADQAFLRISQRGGMTWSPAGWRADGDVIFGGGDLPQGMVALRQPAPGATLSGEARIAPYRAGSSRLALGHVQFSWDGEAIRFGGRASIDGPIGNGFVTGLDLPLDGRVTRAGTLTVGSGCQPVSINSLRLGGFSFGAAQTSVCGGPALAVLGASGLRLHATIGPVRLDGTSAAGARATIGSGPARLTETSFAIEGLGARVGDSHLEVARLDGRFSPSLGGTYSGANGAIAHVPLLLSDADGKWRLDENGLALGGRLRVADAAATPRFLPLLADDVRLTLKGDAIQARATLREPTSHAEIIDVALDHRLTDGAGNATLSVKGISFAPKKLQPEALTPLTLGVVANVVGAIEGVGRIHWDAQGVTSEGSFGTNRLDLAAAFGPVSSIKGRITFTDLLGLVSAPHQEATIAEINPGVAVAGGVVHFALLPGSRVAIEDASWPFASGTLRLEPTTLEFGAETERNLTFLVEGLDAAAFVQQLDFPNLAARGRFDGVLPMIFDARGGRIEGGSLAAREGGGTLAYIGALSSADIGTAGKLAFDALKAIRFSSFQIRFDGRLDGEMISQVSFTGVRQATPEQSLISRMIRNLPFHFNIRIRAPFRGLVGSARAYMDPRLLLARPAATPAEPGIQHPASATMR